MIMGEAMKCPECGADKPQVLQTRRLVRAVRRVRYCKDCGHSWETVEIILDQKAKNRLPKTEQLLLELTGTG